MDCSIKVHRVLGPGLLESVYQACLAYELRKRGHVVDCEEPVPVRYDKIRFDVGFRADMLVDGVVIVENKTMERVPPIVKAQLLTYLRLTERHLGFILNWNVRLMKDGIIRMVHEYEE